MRGMSEEFAPDGEAVHCDGKHRRSADGCEHHADRSPTARQQYHDEKNRRRLDRRRGAEPHPGSRPLRALDRAITSR
jgi:hypothetical protein